MFRCNADGIKIKFRFNKLTSDNFYMMIGQYVLFLLLVMVG